MPTRATAMRIKMGTGISLVADAYGTARALETSSICTLTRSEPGDAAMHTSQQKKQELEFPPIGLPGLPHRFLG